MQEPATAAFSIGRQLNQAMLSAHTAQMGTPSAKLEFVFLAYAHMQSDAAPQRRATALITKNAWHLERPVKNSRDHLITLIFCAIISFFPLYSWTFPITSTTSLFFNFKSSLPKTTIVTGLL